MHVQTPQEELRRRYGTNEEMARMALFLASNGSSYSTGAVFLGDGGFVAR